MRKLNFNDIFAVAEIIRKAKIRQELAALISDISAKNPIKTDKNGENDGNNDKMLEKVGISFVLMIVEAAPTVKDEIFALVASIKGEDVNTVKEMSLKEIKAFIGELAAENDLKDFFFSAVSSLT